MANSLGWNDERAKLVQQNGTTHWLFCDKWQKNVKETCGGKLYKERSQGQPQWFVCKRCSLITHNTERVIISLKNPTRYTNESKRTFIHEPEPVLESISVRGGKPT